MKKLIYGICAIITAVMLATSCNSSNDTTEITVVTTSAKVNSFKMNTSPRYVPDMDSVFFSIDLLNLQIYNADSLPMGSDITKLVPNISTTNASVVELHVPRAGQTDTVINYLDNNNDSIDFSSGNVRLRIVASDGMSTATYRIRVNVHTVPTDTLMWTRIDSGNLPSLFSIPSQQRTVRSGNTLCCLTRSGSDYCMAVTDSPADGWNCTRINFGFVPDVYSLNATGDALYILDTDNNLYSSTDNGVTWSAKDMKMNHIYGALGNVLIGAQQSSGAWYSVTCPPTQAQPIADNMPVAETSQPLEFTPEMGTSSQVIFVGGRKADGSMSADTWGYDGKTWARLSRSAMPYAISNMSLVSYFAVDTTTYNHRKRYPLVMAMNGNRADGKLNDTIYVTRDFGMHWMKADSLMQMPPVIPARSRAQVFDINITLGGTQQQADAMQWKTLWTRPSAVSVPTTGIRPTALEPITTWTCPYLYMFGGVNAEGNTYNTLYRGVINSFTMKPLQ